MVRVSKFRRRSNGYWYIRYWIGSTPVDESAKTKSESAAETCRIRREVELNAGIQPVKYADMADLILRYLDSFPPATSADHRHEAKRVLDGFMEISGRKSRGGKMSLRTERLTPELIDRYINRRQGIQLHGGQRKDSRGRKIVRKRSVSNVTLKKELRYLSGFFNWCTRQRPPFFVRIRFPCRTQVLSGTMPSHIT